MIRLELNVTDNIRNDIDSCNQETNGFEKQTLL